MNSQSVQLIILKVRFSVEISEFSIERIVHSIISGIDDGLLVRVYSRIGLPRDVAWHITGEGRLIEETAACFKAVLDEYGVTDCTSWQFFQ